MYFIKKKKKCYYILEEKFESIDIMYGYMRNDLFCRLLKRYFMSHVYSLHTCRRIASRTTRNHF